MATHPGGAKLIEDLLGKPIDEEYEDAEHTPSATRTLKDLKVVGKIVSEKDEKSKDDQPTKRTLTGLEGF